MSAADFDMSGKVIAAVDAAHAAGMAGDELHELELRSRLDQIARDFMATRPDLEVESLDDWFAGNSEKLTQREFEDCVLLIGAYA